MTRQTSNQLVHYEPRIVLYRPYQPLFVLHYRISSFHLGGPGLDVLQEFCLFLLPEKYGFIISVFFGLHADVILRLEDHGRAHGWVLQVTQPRLVEEDELVLSELSKLL